MLNKRRRASSVASRQEDDIPDDSTPEQSPVLSSVARKRKRLDPSELCQQLYDSIRNIKKEDGTMLCDTFIRAPKRRQEPSYYEVVANPIDLLRVQQKLKTESYDDIEELTTDLDLLVKNAKAFYKPESTEYADACLLWDTFNANKVKLMESITDDEPRIKRVPRQPRRSTANESETSENSNKLDDDFDPYEELFAAVTTATDPLQDNRPLHREFQLLPSKKVYPDYYDVIEHPIDLRLIATKIQTNAYSSLGEMEKDLLQMTRNACMFNEPGSQIYKDAKTLKKIFTAKKLEIESGKAKTTVFKKRGPTLSAITAALKEEPESSDDESEGNEKKLGEGPMWQLFDHLFNAASSSDPPNATGAPLGQSMWKLPYRRFHPEYYEVIKKPISMAQIQKRLKKGDYANISDLTADLYLMLDNAKRAFPPNHKVHKDAVKMLKIMNAKLVDVGVEQITNLQDEESESKDDLEETLLAISAINEHPVCSIQFLESVVMNYSSEDFQHKDASDSDDQDSTGQTDLSPNSASISSISKKKGRQRAGSTANMPASPCVQSPSPAQVILSPKGKNTQPALKKKLLNLQKYLTEFSIGNRCPMALFMEKPSKKLYPDYYNVIQHPIDMNTIENNIRTDKYTSLDDIVGDYRLMFSNCRKYNEEGSMIYEDANLLERALNDKLKHMSGLSERKHTPKVVKPRKVMPLEARLWQLYGAIRDYHEPKGNRQLSLIFMKLPSKMDYPDYYDIIKNPIDMDKILQKLKQHAYDSVDEMASDFLLMFENACKYNEPDSQIYKDALILQQVCIQTKQTLRDKHEPVPDAALAVQELLLSLFTALYNHQDEEGRCYSDSLAELPEYDEVDSSNKVRGISLDLIKRRLDKGLYKRLDIFQEDVFSCLERARRLSRTDSQVFEDSIELQAFFIRKRDELCKDVLTSPALSYSTLHLSAAVEAVRQSKLLQEEQDQEELDTAVTQGESMTIDQKVYSPGDFVYFECPDNKIPGIAYIERLWTNTDNIKMMYGNIFLRPFETYHLTTRKFLEQEVFKTETHQAIPLSKLQNKCYVMSVRDYIKYKPEGFADKDVYVCESRYNIRGRTFKKIKNWPFVRDNDPVKFIQREIVLEPKRIMSVFKERVEKHKGELAELQLQEALVEKEKPNVVCYVNGGEEGNTYYEQYNTICSGIVKTGDYVYVATQSGKQSIAQITSIWETSSGKSYFQGPWLLAPTEIPVPANRLFYRQELLLCSAQDTNPTVAIVGRCAVLDYSEYTRCRPTEISESDVYVCENMFDEVKKSIRKLKDNNCLKKFTHSQMVTPDEIFHFRRPIKPAKMHLNELNPNADQTKSSDTKDSSDIKQEPGEFEDSLDGGPPSVGSDILATSSPAPSVSSTPLSTKGKSNKPKIKIVTGYILYSSDVRRDISQCNPDASFGDISRMVGTEWKNLPASVKQAWEDKAKKINEENDPKLGHSNTSEKQQQKESISSASPTPTPAESPAPPQQQQIYECLWEGCDYQFEDPIDCMEHCIQENNGHVQKSYANKVTPEGEFTCLWKGCVRMKKNLTPFPHLQRLIKHVREVHLNKGGKVLTNSNKSKNYVARKHPAPQTSTPQANTNTTTTQQSSPQQPQAQSQTTAVAVPGPPEPMFVTVPPRPQKVLHSEAYIKYIEGLQSDTRHITPWEKTLKASQKTTPPVDVSKLPTQWLGKHAQDKPEEVVNALWHLRNFMMKDVLEIRRNLY